MVNLKSAPLQSIKYKKEKKGKNTDRAKPDTMEN